MVSFCHGCSTWAKEGGPGYHSEQRDSDAGLCRFFCLVPIRFLLPVLFLGYLFPLLPTAFPLFALSIQGHCFSPTEGPWGQRVPASVTADLLFKNL